MMLCYVVFCYAQVQVNASKLIGRKLILQQDNDPNILLKQQKWSVLEYAKSIARTELNWADEKT